MEREDTTGLWVSLRASLSSEVLHEQEEQVEHEELRDEALAGLGLMTDALVLRSCRLVNTPPSMEDLFLSDFLRDRGRVMMG